MTTETNGNFVMSANPHFVWRFHTWISSTVYLDGYPRLFIWMVIAATQWRLIIRAARIGCLRVGLHR